eukprot:gnl/Chilomastix_cuspidata/3216.p1 GENE.gnl/Chilomastix_cuspidata/3216~~gnl/Chilomastix_cuspidata/3216.p1  ORF type:complete len:1522 (-),score=447.19 gnl/Chilomastix_cuspidata/3216:84-4649(-)
MSEKQRRITFTQAGSLTASAGRRPKTAAASGGVSSNYANERQHTNPAKHTNEIETRPLSSIYFDYPSSTRRVEKVVPKTVKKPTRTFVSRKIHHPRPRPYSSPRRGVYRNSQLQADRTKTSKNSEQSHSSNSDTRSSKRAPRPSGQEPPSPRGGVRKGTPRFKDLMKKTERSRRDSDSRGALSDLSLLEFSNPPRRSSGTSDSAQHAGPRSPAPRTPGSVQINAFGAPALPPAAPTRAVEPRAPAAPPPAAKARKQSRLTTLVRHNGAVLGHRYEEEDASVKKEFSFSSNLSSPAPSPVPSSFPNSTAGSPSPRSTSFDESDLYFPPPPPDCTDAGVIRGGDSEFVNVKVALRIRPMIQQEIVQETTACLFAVRPAKKPARPSENTRDQSPLALVRLGVDRVFGYDYVFTPRSTQGEVFDTLASPLVDSFFMGFNATILAYGQTGSGKTFTMGEVTKAFAQKYNSDILNSSVVDPAACFPPASSVGIIPRVILSIFSRLSEFSPVDYLLRVSFLELYNEEIIDLLVDKPSAEDAASKRKRARLQIREKPATFGSKQKMIYVPNLSEVAVKSVSDAVDLFQKGALARATGETQMNKVSSRSHAIFTFYLDLRRSENELVRSKFHLVDLAGSERVKKSHADGVRFREMVGINGGLLALGNVINALSARSKSERGLKGAKDAPAPHKGARADKLSGVHVPYRDSKLTRLLQDSLGGNAKTIMVACCSPADVNFDETLSTLSYAARARKIQNRPKIIRDLQNDIISSLRAEIARLERDLKKALDEKEDAISKKQQLLFELLEMRENLRAVEAGAPPKQACTERSRRRSSASGEQSVRSASLSQSYSESLELPFPEAYTRNAPAPAAEPEACVSNTLERNSACFAPDGGIPGQAEARASPPLKSSAATQFSLMRRPSLISSIVTGETKKLSYIDLKKQIGQILCCSDLSDGALRERLLSLVHEQATRLEGALNELLEKKQLESRLGAAQAQLREQASVLLCIQAERDSLLTRWEILQASLQGIAEKLSRSSCDPLLKPANLLPDAKALLDTVQQMGEVKRSIMESFTRVTDGPGAGACTSAAGMPHDAGRFIPDRAERVNGLTPRLTSPFVSAPGTPTAHRKASEGFTLEQPPSASLAVKRVMEINALQENLREKDARFHELQAELEKAAQKLKADRRLFEDQSIQLSEAQERIRTLEFQLSRRASSHASSADSLPTPRAREEPEDLQQCLSQDLLASLAFPSDMRVDRPLARVLSGATRSSPDLSRADGPQLVRSLARFDDHVQRLAETEQRRETLLRERASLQLSLARRTPDVAPLLESLSASLAGTYQRMQRAKNDLDSCAPVEASGAGEARLHQLQAHLDRLSVEHMNLQTEYSTAQHRLLSYKERVEGLEELLEQLSSRARFHASQIEAVADNGAVRGFLEKLRALRSPKEFSSIILDLLAQLVFSHKKLRKQRQKRVAAEQKLKESASCLQPPAALPSREPDYRPSSLKFSGAVHQPLSDPSLSMDFVVQSVSSASQGTQ